MPTAFEKLIAMMPKDLKVLDVGYGGLDGENTTNYLRAHFGAIHGLCKDAPAVARYHMLYGNQGKDHVVIGLYPEDMGQMPHDKYDLLVLDMGIDDSMVLWSEEGLKKAHGFVAPGGFLITYIMTTDEYGDERTPEQLRAHRDKWWGTWDEGDIVKKLKSLEDFRFLGIEQEERRDYIKFVLLQKI